MFIEQAFDEFLQFEYEKIDENNVHVRLPIKDLYVNSVGVVHGGIISSLADVAMVNLMPPTDEGKQIAVTVDLNVSFLKPANGEYLIAKATFDKDGRTMIHATCSIYNDQDKLVAKARSILFRLKDG